MNWVHFNSVLHSCVPTKPQLELFVLKFAKNFHSSSPNPTSGPISLSEWMLIVGVGETPDTPPHP